MIKAIVAPANPTPSILATDGTFHVQPDPESGEAFAIFLQSPMDDPSLDHPESPPDLTGMVAMSFINQRDPTEALPDLAPAEAQLPLRLAAPETVQQLPEVNARLADAEGPKPSPGLDLPGFEPTATADAAQSDPEATAPSTSDTRSQPNAPDTDYLTHQTVTLGAEKGIVPALVAASTNLGSTGSDQAFRSEYPVGAAAIASSGIERRPATPPAETDAFSTRLTPVSATSDEKIAAVSRQEGAPEAITTGSSEPPAGASPFGAGPPSTPSTLPSPTTTPASVATPASSPPLVATPTQLPEILSQSIGTDEDRRDRIVVQLDPPELGRVSLEFKFDVQGLQTVTVSSETPEAMRRLRLMHFELVHALEQQGLSADNLNYSQQQSRQHAYQPPSRWSIDTPAFPAPDAADRSLAVSDSRNTSRKIDGLDMRV